MRAKTTVETIQKKQSNPYAPYEQALIEAVLECFDILNDPLSYPTICGTIHAAAFPFIEDGSLISLGKIDRDMLNKEITILCTVPVNSEYLPASEKALKISWAKLTSGDVIKFKTKLKEETLKNGVAGPNSQIIGPNSH